MEASDTTSTKLITVIIALHQQKTELDDFLEWHKGHGVNYKPLVFLIKDSGHNANYLEEIDKSDTLKIFSQPDESIYDAWNQAIDIAETEYVMFLGITDRIVLPDLEFPDIAKTDKDLIFFDFYLIFDQGQKLVRILDDRPLKKFPVRPSFCFSSCVWRREFLAKNRFNPNFRIIGDFDLLLRTSWKIRAGYSRIDPIVHFEAGGTSNHWSTYVKRMREYATVLSNSKYGTLHVWAYVVASFTKLFLRRSS